MGRVVIVIKHRPGPIILDHIALCIVSQGEGESVEVVLTTPSYPLWEWPG